MVGIQNDDLEGFTVMGTQVHGATAKPAVGQVEIFLHRKTVTADFGGMGLTVNSESATSEVFQIIFSSGHKLKDLYEDVLLPSALKLKSNPLIAFSDSVTFTETLGSGTDKRKDAIKRENDR
jgi:hypothetical protein